MRITFFGLLILVTQSCLAEPEKHVTIYATYAFHDTGSWKIPVRVWVHEKPGSLVRAATKVPREALRKISEIDELDDAHKQRFEHRVESFVADNESGEKVSVFFDEDKDVERFAITDEDGNSETDRNGLIEGVITVPKSKATVLLANSSDGWLRLRVRSDRHQGHGWVRFIPDEGLSVISDIDDTIKVTEIIKQKKVVLRNTFFEEFMDAPCMVSHYQSYNKEVSFHYVSGSPWQLYAPLFKFVDVKGFPRGSFHMKSVGVNPFATGTYEDIWKLIANGTAKATKEQKTKQIKKLLERFPYRKFILIGDSGEGDPDIYKNIKLDFKDQIETIYIRDVKNDQGKDPARLDGMEIIDPDSC